MSRPAAVATYRRLSRCRSVHTRAPRPEAAADVRRIEAQRVADRDEGEGPIGVVGGEPVVHLREEAPAARLLDPRPPAESQDGIGQDRDLQTLLGLNAGAA